MHHANPCNRVTKRVLALTVVSQHYAFTRRRSNACEEAARPPTSSNHVVWRAVR